ncbi:MAG TPA: hypothetical protein VFW07_00975 [Parafilimonas sp.]|nr:hypothetical protein [Parafilimonas sp.]
MKKYLGGLLTIILAFGAAAFTAPHSNAANALQWYVFNGGSPSSASNYTLNAGGADPNCPTSPTTVCAIRANAGTGGHPSQSDLNTIASASSNFTKTAANLEYVAP